MTVSNQSCRITSVKRKSGQEEKVNKPPKRIKSEEDLNPGRRETANPSTSTNATNASSIATPAQYFIALPCSPSSYSSSSLSINSLGNNNGHRPHDHHRPESKNIFAIHQQTRCEPQQQQMPPAAADQSEFSSRNGWIATTLVVAYMIEVTVQILLIVECCRSVKQVGFGCWSLVLGSVVSSLLVNLVSLVWVCRGMDFSGRVCGRLLCYVMHSLLLGLLWRYLKLAFAYDRADLEEFFRLKGIHSYVQSLPLVTLHLAWVLGRTGMGHDDSYSVVLAWLVVVELISAVVCLVILPRSNSNSQGATTPGRRISTDNIFDKQVNVDSGYQDKGSRSGIMSAISLVFMGLLKQNGIGRAALLSARLVLLGLAFKISYYWTGLATLLHLSLCFGWIMASWILIERRRKSVAQDQVECGGGSKNAKQSMGDESDNDSGLVVKSEIPEEDTGHPSLPAQPRGIIPENLSLKESVLTRVIPLTYVLYWDMGASFPGLWGSALPFALTLVENIAISIYHWRGSGAGGGLETFLGVMGAICLLVGWVVVPSFYLARGKKSQGKAEIDYEAKVVEELAMTRDEGVNCTQLSDDNDKSCGSCSDKKETGECLPMCCSSLSHPLNIKRKGHHQHQQDLNQPCKTVILRNKRYNEYEEQQEVMGRGAKMRNEPRHPANNAEERTDECGRKKGEDQNTSPVLTLACARSLSVPVTNANYTNIKEALTRRISNKSCTSRLGERSHHQPHYHPKPHHLNQNQNQTEERQK